MKLLQACDLQDVIAPAFVRWQGEAGQDFFSVAEHSQQIYSLLEFVGEAQALEAGLFYEEDFYGCDDKPSVDYVQVLFRACCGIAPESEHLNDAVHGLEFIVEELAEHWTVAESKKTRKTKKT